MAELTGVLQNIPSWAWYTSAGVGIAGVGLYAFRSRATGGEEETDTSETPVGYPDSYSPSPGAPGIVVPDINIPGNATGESGWLEIHDLYLSSLQDVMEFYKSLYDTSPPPAPSAPKPPVTTAPRAPAPAPPAPPPVRVTPPRSPSPAPTPKPPTSSAPVPGPPYGSSARNPYCDFWTGRQFPHLNKGVGCYRISCEPRKGMKGKYVHHRYHKDPFFGGGRVAPLTTKC